MANKTRVVPGVPAANSFHSFSVRLDDDWQVTYCYTPTFRISKVVVEPWRSDGSTLDAGITVQLWNQIRLAGARRYLVHLERSARARADTVAGRTTQKRGRPSKMTTNGYRRLRREYDALLLSNDPAPAKTLALKWKANRSTVRTWLRRAGTRRTELLEQTRTNG